jgi:hypothetical protein
LAAPGTATHEGDDAMGSADMNVQGEQVASSDQTTSAAAGIPAPTGGVGAAELATESSDPAVLRDLLDRARERLAFYESFDRIIGENIRRSGELMVETVALREQARAQAAEFASERGEFDAARQVDREKYRHLVQTALNDVAATRPVIDQLVERLQAALVAFGEEPPPTAPAAAETLTPAVGPDAAPPAPAPASVDAEPEVEAAPPAPEVEAQAIAAEPVTEPVPEVALAGDAAAGNRTVEVLAHGVGTAAIAISLQRTLRELAYVTNVEAREFADGVLRLQVEAGSELRQPDLAEWLSRHDGHIANTSGNLLEINLGATPAT